MTEEATLPIDYNAPSCRRSARAYLVECALEYFVFLLASGTFLARLLTDIGMDDATIGVVSSLISLAFLFQLFTVFAVQRIGNTKRFAVLFHFVGQLFFMGLYFIPFLPAVADSKYRHVLAIGAILLAYFGNYFVASVIYKWGNSFVRPDRRARFSAGKEMISILCGMVVTLIIGFAMDVFENANNVRGGFIFAAIGIILFSACDLCCLLLMKKEQAPPKTDRVPLGEVLRHTLGNRKCVNVILLSILWETARYTTFGFMGTYQLNEGELALSVGMTQVILLAGNLARFALSRPFGAFSDRHSFVRGIELAMVLAAAAFGVSMFTTPKTWFLIILWSILYQGCQAGIEANMQNILYNYVDARYYVEATALKNSIGGLCGFGASLLAGRLLAHIQKSGNRFLGLEVYGQQVLSAISVLLLVAAILFAHLVVAKQKRIIQ